MRILQRLRSYSQRLQPKIVLFFVVLLATLLIVALSFINATNLRIAQSQLGKELQVGERVFGRVLEQNSTQLVQGAKVLAADFGFREAIASRDVGTIASALKNHGDRIKADLVMLSDLDNQLVASTLTDHPSGLAYPFTELIAQAEQQGSASMIQAVDGRLYQLVVVPVRAPITIAWVTMGFAIDDKVAADLQALSSLEVSFVGRGANSTWQLYASTLPEAQRPQLLSLFAATSSLPKRIMLDADEWETRVVTISTHGTSHDYAVLQRSMTAAMAPFLQLQRVLLALAVVSIALCLLGSILIARGIVRPVRLLADAAAAIRDGNYSYPVQVGQKGEIGELADSFVHMQEAIGEREAQILKLAYEDGLTGLPNRQLFSDRLEQALRSAERNKQPLCIVVMDIDRFKFVNDTLGHNLGDVLLREVGRRLQEALRKSDTVARLGGDEFALLLPESTVSDCLPVLNKIQAALREQVVLEGQPVDINVSMGVTGYPEHGADVQALMRGADVAMYVAKRSNSGYAVFDPSYNQFRQEHLSLLGELQRAVELNQLTLYVQPKQHLVTNEIRQAEALVRWIHPERGFIPPIEFIPFAEQTGYIKAVSHWVIAEAIRQLGVWKAEGLHLVLSVNISTRDLLDPGLPDYVQEKLATAGIAPSQICLEITESGFMDEPEQALAILHRLHGLGLSLSIDDYGTGYSSLAYVKKLPVDELKIDRAFIMNMTHNKGDEMIVRSTIDLGHNLGLSVVAEGIDDQATLEMLRQLGCDYAQGFLISKPMPAIAFVEWLAAYRATVATGL